MKWKNKNKIVLVGLVLFFSGSWSAFAQDSAKNELVIKLGYFMNNNKVVYLMIHTQTKMDKKFHPVKGIVVNLYLDNDSGSNAIGKVTTDENGDAKAIIPPALKMVWDKSATHNFIGISGANKEFEETKAESAITKTRVSIDTFSDAGVRSVKISVSALEGSEWVPAKDVEMKVGISRSAGSILSAGDEATYTTDSTGSTTVEYKKDSLPGDQQGNIVLVAKVEDNDKYGNLLAEKTVPWGVAVKYDKNFFDQRTLWSTRFRTPPWLLFMAWSIVISVWGTIMFLVLQIVKIKKLGTSGS